MDHKIAAGAVQLREEAPGSSLGHALRQSVSPAASDLLFGAQQLCFVRPFLLHLLGPVGGFELRVPEADELGGGVEQGHLVDERHQVGVGAVCIPGEHHVCTSKDIPRAAVFQAGGCHRPDVLQSRLRMGQAASRGYLGVIIDLPRVPYVISDLVEESPR